MTSLLVSQKDIYTLCETDDREKQIDVLNEFGIPFEIHPISGKIKIFVKDLTWAAEHKQTGPNLGAA